MMHIHDTRDIEGPMLSGRLLSEVLVVDVSGGGHDQDVSNAVVHEG